LYKICKGEILNRKELYEKYKSMMESITDEPALADENGKIIRIGERWIAVSSRFWPSALMEVAKGLGPVVKTFIYNFGEVCGEAIASMFMEKGIPRDKAVEYIIASGWYFGWCLGYAVKQDFENKYLETIMLENFEADYGKGCHFMRGIHAGVWRRVTGEKVYCEEIECKSKGDEFCRFVVKPKI